ncbi:MAG: LysM peptidoglycan-binding domain-containing protein, partial [Anaerolineales bacterium]|nr:LysM peptidoglycan-binding domain-containing protein [Anaerolineales bacterium]
MNKFRLQFLIMMVLLLLSSTTAASADTTYIIQRGDTLASIARRFGVTISQLVEANNIVNPNLIYVNQQLVIPTNGSGPAATPPPVSSGSTTTHVVSAGETMYRIALRYGVTVQVIVQANGISNPNVIYVGQSLIIPVSGGQAPQPTVQPTAVPVQPTATAPQPTATSTSPQPTAVPLPTSTPVVIPNPNTSGNLLANSSFEGGWYHPGNIPELQIPNNWRFEWDEGATGFGNEVWDVWRRPEVRVLSRQYLPPEEHDLFIWNGNQTVKIFKGSAPISFRLLSDVTLQPGKYTLEIKLFP